ncbi:50S ribosomal protein L36, partial [Francisella tularensis]
MLKVRASVKKMCRKC